MAVLLLSGEMEEVESVEAEGKYKEKVVAQK